MVLIFYGLGFIDLQSTCSSEKAGPQPSEGDLE